MNVEDVEDMNRSDAMGDMYKTEPEKASNIQTEESFIRFKELMDAEVKKYEKKGEDIDYYYVLRNACFWAFFPEFVFCVSGAVLSETFGVFYSYFIGFMIRYIKDEEETSKLEGLKLVGIFFVSQLLAQNFRNRYILGGFFTTVKLRRTLVAAMYDKVARLSMKSMTETNSGKLISLISADLFSVERGLSFFPLLVAAPIINFIAYGFIYQMVGIYYTLVAFACWIILIML